MQSLSLTLTQGALNLQAALPAATDPDPTIDFDGKVPSGIKTFQDNLVATFLYVGGGFFVIAFLVLAGKTLGGAKKGAQAVGALVLAIVCLIPASAMTWASEAFTQFQGS